MFKAAAKRAIFLLCTCLFLLASCAGQSNVTLPVLADYYKETAREEKSMLKLGVVTGPYGDMFTEIIEPLLAQKGYSLELVVYDNYVDPNFALANGEIDFNVFQHYQYLNSFKFEYNLDLSAIAEIPTAAMGVYSRKYDSFDALEEGDVIAIPNDSTNLSRALIMLSTAGVISLDPAIDNAKLTLRHITKNSKQLEFVTMEAHLLCDALDSCDMAVINGNFAISSGFSPSDALFNETLTSHDYINVIAVRTDDLSRRFVMDMIGVLQSDAYKNAIMQKGGKYDHYQYPCNFSTYMN